ncbi:hypothetical protein HUK80_17485 [Flavobacterium sp. MAH-1]|uniref:DUF4840 domain-containing protein n=1 Tax=Flavobacterium agri TaxID=2743471 RepID=A0A7Y9C8S0_9FLAO|nr:hypothetical protein [Flavobacterium agri]NUY82699.1 hypothetical protein [Flavobacterium agri]NYA72722.1 hypothetical protein [Flavobacterium agri]
MKATSLVVAFGILSLFAVSCRKAEDPVKDDLEFRYYNLEKMGWKSRAYTQKVDDIGFTATEVPIQYYLLKDQGMQDLKTVDSIYEKNKTERVIEVTFAQQDEKDLMDKAFTGMEYEDALKYISFGIDRDFYVVTAQHDTIPCQGVNYERLYKIAPFQRVLLFFSGIDPNQEIQLIYEDHLFRKGTLKFKFNNNKEILL